MSKLDELIQELCPDGVEYSTLGSLGKFYGGLSGKSKDDFSGGNAKFLTYMNIFLNPSLKLDVADKVKIGENEKQNKVVYGDVIFTGSSEKQNECGMSSVLTEEASEDIYLNSFCFIFRLDNLELFKPDFLKHLFRSAELRKQINRTASGVTRFNVSKKKMEHVSIPVPPLPVQEEIVRILDNFTELTAELTAELTERKKQYEYYRDRLFSGQDSLYEPLSTLADIGTGSSNTNEGLEIGDYPFFVRSKDIRWKNEYQFDETAIITSGDGVGVGKIFHYIEGKYALHQRAYRIHVTNERLIPKFFYHYMKLTFLRYIEKNAVNSSVTSVRRPMMDKYPVPLPPLAEQQRIVDILDRFDTLCNDISSGLPAEIKMRQQQYEHYRDKLLSFKKLEA